MNEEIIEEIEAKSDVKTVAAEEEKESHIGTPEINLSATDFTYKYKVKTVKSGKKKKSTGPCGVRAGRGLRGSLKQGIYSLV